MSQTTAFPIVIVGHVDHGKSTLVGRLMHDTGAIADGAVEALQASSAKRGSVFEWSHLLDALQIERDQGITLDTTQVWFTTPKRRYVIIDAPGHKEFLKNMVTGAAAADAAILVVDARAGLAEQTRRHAYLLRLLGITQVAVAVNKIDLIDHDEARFAQVVDDVGGYLRSIGINPTALIPLSARHGDGIVAVSPQTPWYKGPSLLEALDNFAGRPSLSAQPLRLPVQDLYRRGERRIVVGRIETGRLRVGDTIRLLPGNRTVKVAGLEGWNLTVPKLSAIAGESVALAVDEDVFVERGALITEGDTSARQGHVITLRIFWLDRSALNEGDRLTLRLGTASNEVTVRRIDEALDLESLALNQSEGPGKLESGGIARVTLHSRRPIIGDRFADNPRLGRAVLARDYRLVGGGIVEDLAEVVLSAPETSVTPEERAALNGHSGGVLWLTGLSGSGKSTIAQRLLRKLTDQGRLATVLDGDTLRLGLSRDLGFSAEDRAEQVRRTAEVAKLLANSGLIVIASLISPRQADRDLAEQIIGDAFHEIFVDAALETCIARDPKGLYKRAQAGEIPNFTGISSPYEAPQDPALRLDTATLSLEDATDTLLTYAQAQFARRHENYVLGPAYI
ncbi:adenylyl-sulfate kinase [Elstera cyanobacteriorum]|uniref:adenylyl-sulfate kinase n=1 Tax=Elstera cyanobacteriorum TaxID=2022747 RepID=UPI002354C240|nr:adenylyl-sulfate kinase [Elstera cyanobacteriorum]MCK6443512.1 adenylyl-sulfate kinase [Elstera cyanobacteriorum]